MKTSTTEARNREEIKPIFTTETRRHGDRSGDLVIAHDLVIEKDKTPKTVLSWLFSAPPCLRGGFLFAGR